MIMETKYKLDRDDSICFGTKKLYRVVASRDFGSVCSGDIGGYVESEKNLSHEGDCWIHGDAMVYGNAEVSGNSKVYGNATVSCNAKVYGNATVYGCADISDNAKVYGNATLHSNAVVRGNAAVYGNAKVWGNATIYRHAKIYGTADVHDNAAVWGNAEIYEQAEIASNALVFGNSKVHGNAIVYGAAILDDDVEIFGVAHISGHTVIYDSAKIFGNSRVYGQATVHGLTKIYGKSRICGYANVSGRAELCGCMLQGDVVFNKNGSYTNLDICKNDDIHEDNLLETKPLSADTVSTICDKENKQKLDNKDDLQVGDVVAHFKREISDTTKNPMIYLYIIESIAEHTETGEKLVIYKALYSDDQLGIHYGRYARPYDMFISEVDHEKYPDIKQKYRFERFENLHTVTTVK